MNPERRAGPAHGATVRTDDSDTSAGGFIAGRRPVLEALKSGALVERVYLARGGHGDILHEIRQAARERNVLCTDVDKRFLEKLAGRTNSQGVVAIVGTKSYTDIDGLLGEASRRNEKPFFLVFDEIEDPHNLGALIRTAVCVGAHGGILPKHGSAPINETVAKTSAGASSRFPVAKVTNIVSALGELKEHGVWIVGTDAEAGRTPAQVDLTMPVAIVIGNEGRGIRRLVKESCDHLVRIPMAPGFDSFNASVAGALIMYEVFRARSGR